MASSLDSAFPVLLPESEALFYDDVKFEKHIKFLIAEYKRKLTLHTKDSSEEPNKEAGSPTKLEKDITSTSPSLSASASPPKNAIEHTFAAHPFVRALAAVAEEKDYDFDSDPDYDSDDLPENQMRTENNDLTNISTTSPLVDLFTELEATARTDELKRGLEKAWAQDPLATLKIIFNARSIHLGKASKPIFYRACGWLYCHHPLTFLANLRWLTRPVIEKKAPEKDEDGFEEITKDSLDFAEDDFRQHDVKHGVSHGYWKDLLNMLVLAANDDLHEKHNPKTVLNIPPPTGRRDQRNWSHEEAQKRKAALSIERHKSVLKRLEDDDDGRYQAFHLCVARLFAEQLSVDKKLLESNDKKDKRRISLAAKWAPSFKGFHDQHTFIVSSIAEILHPKAEVSPDTESREQYLKRARLVYQQKTLSPLRKALGIVERDLSARTFGEIHYDRVPSIAMNQHFKTFFNRDTERFEKYVNEVAEGKSRISGATLLPSTLISTVRGDPSGFKVARSSGKVKRRSVHDLVQRKVAEIRGKAVSGQWKTLVQRIRDSGTLSSSIAVCDVSGSMQSPRFDDGTCPLDSAIGLSLLVAEVTEPPFGGLFITFSQTPEVVLVGGKADTRSLSDKVHAMLSSNWGMNTDFAAVFEKLLLPIAERKGVKPEDMVKQIFVFSDMQFDQCGGSWKNSYATSYQRIKRKYTQLGYQMPKLVFWNLAGGSRSGTAPKPVTTDDLGTALVSGYSQGMLKVFLENGHFSEEEEEVEITEKDATDELDIVDVEKKFKKKSEENSLTVLNKAIGHKAYDMLRVVD